MSRNEVTTANFAQSSDAQLREAARKILGTVDASRLRPKFRRWLKSDRAPIEDVGAFVWAELCKWKRGGLAQALKKEVA